MLITIVPLLFTAIAAYYAYNKFVKKNLECPANNPDLQGLDKEEIKNLVKETEKQKKQLEEEIKTKSKEIKEETDKDQKATKTEERAEKIKEAKELGDKLEDYKGVEKGDWKASLPNKLSTTNVIWVIGFLIGIVVLYKVCVSVFRALFQAIGLEL